MKTNNLTTTQKNLFIGCITCCILLFGKQLHAQETIVINEINYRNVSLQDNIKFIELYNHGSTQVDISNWHFSGGVNYTFPSGTIMNGDSYLVVDQDDMTGNLSTSGDHIFLRNHLFNIVDEVDYESWKEWPNVRFEDTKDSIYIPQRPALTEYKDQVTIKVAKSIQKINPLLNGKHGGSWIADIPTPNGENEQYDDNIDEYLPVLKSVSKTPDKPTSNQAVRIKADFDNHEDYKDDLNVFLEYQINTAGSYKTKDDNDYTFLSIQMLDDGDFTMSGDSTADNGLYTAIIPGTDNQDRSLIRYKIRIEAANGYVRYFPDPLHTENNYSYYVYDGDEDFLGYDFSTVEEMQNITVISKNEIVDKYISTGDNDNQHDGYDYGGEGTLIYNGKIFDHVTFRPRGKTRNARIKPGIKFRMNNEKRILLENDCGKDYDVERDNLVLSGTWVNDEGSHGLVESLIYKILKLTKGWYANTDYVNLRIVDSATENGVNGDFWGLFLIIEDNNGELLDEHKLPDGNIWTTYDPPGNLMRFMYVDYFGDFSGSTTQLRWLNPNAAGNVVTPDESTLNKEMFYGDWIANEFWANGELNYFTKHSYREYYNPETNLWHGWCKDYDGAFGSGNNVIGVSTTEIGDFDPNFDITQPLAIPSNLNIEYEGELRSAVDLLLNEQQRNFLVDSELAKIYDESASYDWTTLDHARWGSNRPCPPSDPVGCDTQTYHEDTVDKQFEWYKDWFELRKNYLVNSSTHGILDNNIPQKPLISLTGSHAIDNLSFNTTNFSDPNGSAFSRLEWRIGEWSDPNNPTYDDKCEPIYEIETVWESGEIFPFSNSFTFPPEAQLKVGRTYKVRVRYKDNSGRWSHWSNPYQFVSQAAQDQDAFDIVINEIMYKPNKNCGSEFIEIFNNENFGVTLNNYKFSKGVDFDFPIGTTIGAKDYIVLAKDSLDFTQKFGFSPFGEYRGNLNDDGDYIEFQAPFRVIVDSLTYNDKNPWDEAPDINGVSLELLDPTLDNSDPLSWFRSDNLCGTPANENSRICNASPETIVINELNYNSDNDVFDPGDWVELHNPGNSAVNISNWTFYDNANEFIIPQGTIIGPEAFIVLVENDTLFTPLFPDVDNTIYISNFSFNLSGKGERINLFDDDKCLVDYVIYDDKSPWPTEPDGDGPSLSLIDPNLDNALPASWESSVNVNSPHGTPGCPNSPIDCFDLCPNDPNKTDPGTCGCGIPDTDSDSDGTPDCIDNCPTDPNKTQAGICGCGITDIDSDSDGTPNCNDGCPSDSNKIQPGICGCGIADTDTDSDGTPNCNDNCPTDPNKTSAGLCGCGVSETDTDLDGTLDCLDACPTDPAKTQPGICGCGNTDIDNDNNGLCDVFEDPCSVLFSDDFENGTGNWNLPGVGNDAFWGPSGFSEFGSNSMIIQDNSPGAQSTILTNTLNLSQVNTLKIVFDYRSIGFVTDQSFFLELSTDGGSSFVAVNEWINGTDFNDNVMYSDSISIPNNQLSATTVIRFRCFGSINSDKVYLDNIKIKSCPDACDNILLFSDNTMTNTSEEAIIGIETNRIISTGSNVAHHAGDYILMTPGFEVKSNTQFHAFIEACQ